LNCFAIQYEPAEGVGFGLLGEELVQHSGDLFVLVIAEELGGGEDVGVDRELLNGD
jgi:hypothetical protein